MTLTEEQIAAAEAVGCSFQPVAPAQLARFSMQRKVFHIDGAPVLATRGGGLFETAATLEGLLELGRERIRAGLAQAPAEAPTPPPPPPEQRPDPPAAVARTPRRAARPAATSAPDIMPAVEDQAAPEPLPATPPAPARVPPTAPAARAHRDRGSREPRWMTAGAERRGRAAVHWSTRLR